MLLTPNPGVLDEKVCTHVFTTLTYSVRPVTTANIPCILGSGTECMTQVIYEWNEKSYSLLTGLHINLYESNAYLMQKNKICYMTIPD